MNIIVIANHKGGCGKSTTAINLAYSLSLQQQKTLLVDFDPQGHSTLGLNIVPERLERTIYDLLLTDHSSAARTIPETIVPLYQNLDLLPSNMQLAFLEQQLAQRKQREFRLAQLLSKLKYDYIIIDTAPALGLLTVNALVAANRVIVPLEPSNFALHGLKKLEETLSILKLKLNHQPKLKFLLTLFRSDSQYCQYFKQVVEDNYSDFLFETNISFSDHYREAAAFGQPVALFNRSSGQAYYELAKETVQWSKKKSKKTSPAKIDQEQESPTQKIINKLEAITAAGLLTKTNSEINPVKFKFILEGNGSRNYFEINSPQLSKNIYN